ncbi:glycoside hydrolase family 31 protein [Massilia sp. YIM B02763]|uniref:glycoside hydrolase family 31 protein n=1 Tax=Massilia sp. YIM B02763 TaxID=3050130 RepID=UPI0025B6FC57|nr:TIM-barrel domain-containing protein [Massilia sp. YIM B02763]MDN4054001.1 glycoside hydrolase family 31 protein [Massilia sp. YIM B02763]
MTNTHHARLALCLAVTAAFAPLAHAQNADRRFVAMKPIAGGLEVTASDGRYLITSYAPNIVETTFVPKGQQPQPGSHAVVLARATAPAEIKADARRIELAAGGMTVTIDKTPFRIAYAYKGRPLVAEKRGYGRADQQGEKLEALEFALNDDEALYGAGSRAVGMNRRGNRFRLYNKASYGFGARAEQMGYGIPVALSSRKYAIHFDNPQAGWLEMDSRHDGTLRYETMGGPKTYQVVAGDDWAEVMDGYTRLTGRQPLPPRWAFGNFASRFGYHTEAETRAVVDQFAADGIPLDAVVLDLYWFGKTVKGTMGNLAWDRESFPRAEAMMADFARKGVKTVLITEPFILTTSKRWQEASRAGVLATGKDGKPLAYDFYFGNTGLVDVFKPQARDWFWNIYKDLKAGGVAGWWGDLGEPEVHPAEARHATPGGVATADQVHNIYGHEWAHLIADGYARDFPAERPFILMRSGYSGSQRFGMIPWSGDVSRGWGGLQSQMEISLQMGMQGQAYMHSDLGGFAGPVLDDELYVRWLQYGVFQPIFRPHAQEQVPAEPVFRTPEVKVLAREAIRLRYAMLPYNYTIAFENSRTGMPLMRPVMFEEPDNDMAPTTAISGTYLWGPDFLVAPVTEPGAARKEMYFPKIAGHPEAAWYDFYTGAPHRGGIIEVVPTVREHIPTFVRAGAFVPLATPVLTTRDYTTRQLELHYWHDPAVTASEGRLYDDDGQTARAYETGKYELVRFGARASAGRLDITLAPQPGSAVQPAARTFVLKVHNVAVKPRGVEAGGKALAHVWDEKLKLLEVKLPVLQGTPMQVGVAL